METMTPTPDGQLFLGGSSKDGSLLLTTDTTDRVRSGRYDAGRRSPVSGNGVSIVQCNQLCHSVGRKLPFRRRKSPQLPAPH